MSAQSGYSFYGQDIGILVFSGTAPRIPGDAGHAGTFSYPVRYQIVDGGFSDLIDGSSAIHDRLIDACRTLKHQGIRGIVGDCGLWSLYQTEIGRTLHIPFAGSSLCQIPVIWQMIGCSGTIGIITGHSGFLKETHLKNSGWQESIPLSIEGMQCMQHFSEVVINGVGHLDIDLMRRDVLKAAKNLYAGTPDLRAVILECSNLATYSHDVSDYLNIPVFDTISAANLLHYSLRPPVFAGQAAGNS